MEKMYGKMAVKWVRFILFSLLFYDPEIASCCHFCFDPVCSMRTVGKY